MMHVDDNEQRYAFMEWRSKWNNAEQVAALNQSGSAIYLTTCMGTILLDLDDTESINAFCAQMSAAIQMVKNTKKGYDDGRSAIIQ